MDCSRIVWEKILETRLWVIINLALPAFIIPIAAMPYWFRNLAVPWMRIVREGQLCFYAVVILAASGYEIVTHWTQPYVASMIYAVGLIGVWAVLIFGFIFADGAEDLPRQFDDSKVVKVSLLTAGSSAVVAWITHALAEGALK